MVTKHDRSALLAKVPQDGRAVGNTSLMRALEWPEDRYWAVRDDLIGEGLIERARGRGGSIRRLAPPIDSGADSGPPPAEELVSQVAQSYQREIEMYPSLRDVIATDWAKVRQARPLSVEITAMQGRRPTGGRWSRPDIVSVEVKTYRYVPGKFLEVITYEVKPCDAIDVSAVYEAMSHLRSATHSYVILHVPAHSAGEYEDAVDDVCELARAHGIGVIVVNDPGDYTTWTEREEAVRHEPDPQRLDAFIATQLLSTTADLVTRALR